MLLKDFLIKELPEVQQKPFPHFEADGLFNETILDSILKIFPPEDSEAWAGGEDRKLVSHRDSERLPSYIREALDCLMTDRMCDMLSERFNTPPLIPTIFGGGIHMSLQNTMLPFHTDWQRYKGLYRWLNFHIYLNKHWEVGSGGELILLGNGVSKIPPTFNKTICYRSAPPGIHGHPILWKPKSPRINLSVYYFSEVPSDDHLNFEDRNAKDIILNDFKNRQ